MIRIAEKKLSGFSLIELVAAMAVIGILAGIIYPGYLLQVKKTRRADAKVSLARTVHQLERCFTEFNAYNNVNCVIVSAGPTVNMASVDGHYTITTNRGGETLTATAYTLFAVPVNSDSQASDYCGTFIYDSLGNKINKDSSGSLISSELHCWQ